MSEFIFGVAVCLVLLTNYPSWKDALTIVTIAIVLFTGGWNWAKFAIKKGWIK